MTTNLKTWAETASEGDYLTQYEDMTAEEMEPGRYVVTQDDSDAVLWEGEAPSEETALQRASEADTGSRCGWDDADLAEVNRILVRSGMVLQADDRGLVAARRT